MYILEVLSGPLDGKTWNFDREITIGRDDALAGACITLDRFISRQHAQLREDGEKLVLTDLSSRNGTKIGGQSVTTATPIALGDRFVVGRTLLRVKRA
ncbi:MAG TPA: FHA domain-containing protein [Candidatus Baltobacteraceae bacterium]|nr:FHA domain-containing protein [Candidatus Baltobacteraceae bacterium]